MRSFSFLFVALAIALPSKRQTSRRQLMAGVSQLVNKTTLGKLTGGRCSTAVRPIDKVIVLIPTSQSRLAKSFRKNGTIIFVFAANVHIRHPTDTEKGRENQVDRWR
jgi:hypothetical protein